ncbi:zinc ribbon domain-containing protein [Halomicroarcula sp. GCM10025710]
MSVPATIECPDCGTELAADANFCIECGADVQAVDPGDDLTECPSCGTELSGDENFCANCGEDLDAHRGQGDGEADDTAAEDAVDALAAQSDEGAEAVPESLVLSVLGTDIEVADGDRVGREVRAALTDAGRTEDEAVRVHREHVRFIREADGFYLVDLGDNPTKLNGRALTKGDREPVGPGDEVDLSGVATLTIEAP